MNSTLNGVLFCCAITACGLAGDQGACQVAIQECVWPHDGVHTVAPAVTTEQESDAEDPRECAAVEE